MTELISRGPQFKGFVSTLGLIIFPFALILGIVAIVKAAFLPGFLLLILAAAAFFLFLDVRGVEIDYEKKLIRRYKQYISLRWGEWFPLEEFTEIHLAKDAVYLRHFTPGAGRYGRPSSASKITTYDVYLKSELDNNNILLSEFEKHPDAVAFLHTYAQKLQVPARDIFKELQNSALARRKTKR